MDENDEHDKEFEKFLMASMSGSENTSALNTGRSNKKSLEWNLSSSEDIMQPSNSRFLKNTGDSDILRSLPKAPEAKPVEPESGEPSTKTDAISKEDGILSVLEGLGMDPQITESLTETETENRESLERQEFANRLANQNSALVSLGNVQAGMAQDTGSPKDSSEF